MRTPRWIFAALLTVVACDESAKTEPVGGDDADDTFFVGGKADNGFDGCALDNVLRYVNGDVTVEGMKAKGVHTRAAKRIVAFRAGPDAALGTDDDAFVVDLAALDAIKYVGPVALRQLVAAAGTDCPSAVESAVIFSPQLRDDSHLARVVGEISKTQRSIDIAMYSFRDGAVIDALAEAVANRGVKVRLVFEGARGDRSDPQGSRSGLFESMGFDVRYINKIMHHKFAIFDGPLNHRDEALGTRLATGSGNWSSSAATKYDENTVFLENHAEAALRFQRQFNLLWENSRDFESDAVFDYYTTLPITDADIAAMGDDPGFDVAWTSANFRTYVSARFGPTFSAIRGSNAVSDRVVALIEGARSSIHVASGHLRSRPISEALMRAAQARPNLDIRVYLDGQEYISEWGHDDQLAGLDDCLEAAEGSAARTDDCMNKGFRFGYAVGQKGVDVRYKYYHFKWDVRNAYQMHHKYLIVDRSVLATGSYNFSDNAEHNTLENMVIYDAAVFPELVEDFEANFEATWVTGEGEGLYDVLLDDIRDGVGDVPLHFDAMAIDHSQIATLKRAISDACPQAYDLPLGTRICEL
ncbi:MAG: phosphatidylserine/phosphatidylglycerophosphate/cardiolipin synthase-like enzyme [Bradymonadia bacterium]|jgi:phosphatidylserine/phosphatidylglycerophosphate/cardiolipin synthase-like enzyme